MARKTNSNYIEADQIMLAGWGKSTQNRENCYKSIKEYKNGCFLPESAFLVKEETCGEMDPALMLYASSLCELGSTLLRLQTIMVIVNSLSQEFARIEFWWASKSASPGLVLS